MSTDDRIQNTVEQALTGLRGQLEGELRAFVEQLQRAEVEERHRVVARAVESTSDDLRKESEERLAQVREAAQAQVEALRQEAARQAQSHVHELESARSAAAAEADALKREIEGLAMTHQRELDEVRKTSTAEAEARLSEKVAVVSEDHWRRMNAASATIEELKQELAQVRTAVAEEVESRFSGKLAASTAEHEREMSAAGAKIDTLLKEIDEIKAAAEDAERRVTAQLAVAIDDRERDRRETSASLDEMAQEVSEARAAVAVEVEQRQREQTAANASIAALTREVEEVRQSLTAEAEERLGAQLAVAVAQHERALQEGVVRARADERQEDAARAARLEHAVRALDDARSLSSALEELGRCAAREADRAAVLLLKGGRLQGWRLFGFGDVAQKAIDLDLEHAGIAGEVVRSGEAQHGSRHELPGFAQGGGAARAAYALPVTVGWTVVAVLYADAPLDADGLSRWPATLGVLARHASKVLEATTLQQAAGLSTSPPTSGSSAGVGNPGSHQQSLQ